MHAPHYRIYVGPYIHVMYSPAPCQTPEQQDEVLGSHLMDAVKFGLKRYGPHHEVRVTYHPRAILE